MSIDTKPSPHPGILIAFEGLEGAGKTEMAHRLVESLNADASHGYNQAEYVSEWQTRLGKKAKEALRFEAVDGQDFDPTPNNAMSEALLILAAKNEFIVNVVRPGVAAGKILICDRYTGTFMAYQGGMRQLGQARLAGLMQATQTDVMPNVEIFFEVSDETRRARRAQVRDHMEAAVDNISDEMRDHYTSALQYLPRYQRIVIDANGDRDTVFAQLLTAIKARLKLHRITGASINKPPTRFASGLMTDEEVQAIGDEFRDEPTAADEPKALAIEDMHWHAPTLEDAMNPDSPYYRVENDPRGKVLVQSYEGDKDALVKMVKAAGEAISPGDQQRMVDVVSEIASPRGINPFICASEIKLMEHITGLKVTKTTETGVGLSVGFSAPDSASQSN